MGARQRGRGRRENAFEVVYFSWIVYQSRRHRDAIVKKIMKDQRITAMMEKTGESFDMERMLYGGFKVVVDK